MKKKKKKKKRFINNFYEIKSMTNLLWLCSPPKIGFKCQIPQEADNKMQQG